MISLNLYVSVVWDFLGPHILSLRGFIYKTECYKLVFTTVAKANVRPIPSYSTRMRVNRLTKPTLVLS
jgi:hypothetical protein